MIFYYNKKAILLILLILIIDIKSCFNFFKCCIKDKNFDKNKNNKSIIEMNKSDQGGNNENYNEENENKNKNKNEINKIFIKTLNEEMSRFNQINKIFHLDKKTPSFVFTYNVINIDTMNLLFNIDGEKNDSLNFFNKKLKSLFLVKTDINNMINYQELLKEISIPCFFSLNNSRDFTYDDFVRILNIMLNSKSNLNNDFITIKEIEESGKRKTNSNNFGHYSFSTLNKNSNNNDDLKYITNEFYKFPNDSNLTENQNVKNLFMPLFESFNLIKKNEYNSDEGKIDVVLKYILIETSLNNLYQRSDQNLNKNNVLFSIQIMPEEKEKYKIIKSRKDNKYKTSYLIKPNNNEENDI